MFTVHADDGSASPPQIGGEYVHASTARRAAIAVATEAGVAVQVYANGRPRFRVLPGGVAGVPRGVVVDRSVACVASEGGGACFCAPCREERKGRR